MASIFTKIINGELPARFVWSDDDVVAFLDVAPLTRGHTLVVPIQEVDSWTDLEPELRDKLFTVAQTIGKAQLEAFGAPRAGVVIQGFEVAHCHVHVFPAHSARDFDLANKHEIDASELDEDQRRLRDAIIATGHPQAEIDD